MKAKTTYNGKTVTITLTDDQLSDIRKQSGEIPSVEGISYKSALALLKKHKINPDPGKIYNGVLLELATVIKAVNFIDNGLKEWVPTSTEQRILPWFKRSGSGWVFVCWNYFDVFSYGPAALFFKTTKSAEDIAKRFLSTHYSKIL